MYVLLQGMLFGFQVMLLLSTCVENCVKFDRLKLFILIALLFSNVKIFLEPVPRNI